MPDDDKRFTPEYEVADASNIRLVFIPLAVVVLIVVALAILLLG